MTEFVLPELNAREYVATVLCVKFLIHQVFGLFIPVKPCECAITSKPHVLLNVYMNTLMALKGSSNKNICVGWEDERFFDHPLSATFRTKNHGLMSLSVSLSSLLLDYCYKIFVCY